MSVCRTNARSWNVVAKPGHAGHSTRLAQVDGTVQSLVSDTVQPERDRGSLGIGLRLVGERDSVFLTVCWECDLVDDVAPTASALGCAGVAVAKFTVLVADEQVATEGQHGRQIALLTVRGEGGFHHDALRLQPFLVERVVGGREPRAVGAAIDNHVAVADRGCARQCHFAVCRFGVRGGVCAVGHGTVPQDVELIGGAVEAQTLGAAGQRHTVGALCLVSLNAMQGAALGLTLGGGVLRCSHQGATEADIQVIGGGRRRRAEWR